MAYTLTYSGGTITVNDGTLNSTTSLQFPGRNYAGYGTYVDQNLLSMLENFASSTTGPSNAIKGQIWFDASNSRLKYNTSSTIGSPSWKETITSGIGQDISVRNITMADSSGTVNGILTTRAITTGSTATSGTLTGQWTLPVGSSLSGNIVIPTASTTQLGGIKVGSGLTIDGSGVLSAVGGVSGVSQIIAGSNISISSTEPGGTGIVTINAGGSGGSGVTSVAITSGDMTVTGSPITGAGSIGLSLNTVPIAKGGTGATTQAAALNALLPTQTGNSGALLTTNGTNASWAPFASSATTNGYTTLPGGIRLAWGSVNFGDIYAGHDTETISFSGLFSQIFNVQVQLQRNTANPGSGAAYPIITDNLTESGFSVYLQETTSGFGPYYIYWSAIGIPAAPGTPTGLNFTPNWTNQGPTSTVTLTGTATGSGLQYDWSIDGGATYPVTNTNPGVFSGIDNSTVSSLAVRMRVRNSAAPSGVTFTQTVTNPNYSEPFGPGGGGGTDPGDAPGPGG